MQLLQFEQKGRSITITDQWPGLKGFGYILHLKGFNIYSKGCPEKSGCDIYLRGTETEYNHESIKLTAESLKKVLPLFQTLSKIEVDRHPCGLEYVVLPDHIIAYINYENKGLYHRFRRNIDHIRDLDIVGGRNYRYKFPIRGQKCDFKKVLKRFETDQTVGNIFFKEPHLVF